VRFGIAATAWIAAVTRLAAVFLAGMRHRIVHGECERTPLVGAPFALLKFSMPPLVEGRLGAFTGIH